MPAGSVHAVGTVYRRHQKPMPAIFHGFFFDSRHTMPRTLGALIQCAHWHQQWTNVLAPARFSTMLWFVLWQLSKPVRSAPFQEENLFALIFIAQYGPHLEPLEFPSHNIYQWLQTCTVGDGVNTVLWSELKDRLPQLLRYLTLNQLHEYRFFEERYIDYITSSYTSLTTHYIS